MFFLILLIAGLFFSPAISLSQTTFDDTKGPVAVQTFSFDDIEKRRELFEFPDDDRNWRRILMRYTLKCDEATVGDPYPCGEWDVTTHVIAHVHTGVLDSTLQRHPSYIVEGESPAEYRYSESPTYHYSIYWEDPGARERGALMAGRRAGEKSAEGDYFSGDHYLRFSGTDYIDVPPLALAGIDSSLTISFWARGSAAQPLNDHVIEAGETGGRVVNIHLPWGTGIVYWDAGGRLGGNNNRLSKQARPSEFKGLWNHWAFTKDAGSGEMKIFLNGEEWHSAGNMKKAIPPIDSFVIGANLYRNNGWYAGDLDDVRVWDIALEGGTIAAWRHRAITADHPYYKNLRVEYRFEDSGDLFHKRIPEGSMQGQESAGRIIDSSPHGHHGNSFGQPQLIPFGFGGSADLKPGPGAVARIDSIAAQKVSVQLFEDEDDPTRQTRVLDVWPAYNSWYTGDGQWLEDLPVDDAQILEQEERTWYGEPFEVIEKFELARFITPYGKRLDLGEDGFTWIYDVTDYAPFLRGEVDLQAGNTLELLDLKFEFYEGTPPRTVLDIRNLWPMANYSYRNLSDDNDLKPVVVQLDGKAAGYQVKSCISGHGHAGPEHCCEWDAKEHFIKIAGFERFQWLVWRDCGMNPVHPQGGTWQFDRAGWCPGTFVDKYEHELTAWVDPGQEVVLDYAIEPYDPENGEADGQFIVAHQLFTYGPPNLERDAELLEILAPTAHGEYRRINPVSGDAIVRIRNNGSENLESLQIRYGLIGGNQHEFDWKGNLGFLEAEIVTLPAPDWTGAGVDSRFQAELERPNGRDDQQRANNSLAIPITPPHILPAKFTIHVRTPGFERAKENSYIIIDREGRIVASRQQFEDDQVYDDPIQLEPGAYTFEFLDSEEDGMIRHWWLRGSDPEKMGENGALMIFSAGGDTLMDLGYDFAEKRTIRFFVGEPY